VPLTKEERLDKFRVCTQSALPPRKVDEVIRLVDRLADLKDVAPIMEIVAEARVPSQQELSA
jgi:hypothetical protein